MPHTPRTQPPPPPLELNLVGVSFAGTLIWVLAAAALTLFGQDWLREHGRTWWLGTAYSGILIGILGTLGAKRITRATQRAK